MATPAVFNSPPTYTPPVNCKEIWIPKNEENTCWWLSINLALFHKERPELRDRFARFNINTSDRTNIDIFAPININTSHRTIVDIFHEIYQHYSDPYSLAEDDKEDVKTFLIHESRQQIEELAGAGEPGFQINSNTYQPASEYLLQLMKWLADDTDKLETVFIPIINADNPTLNFEDEYDIYLHRRFSGLARDWKKGNEPTITNKTYLTLLYEFYQIPSTRQTLVLSFERRKQDGGYASYTINPLEFLTIPTAGEPSAEVLAKEAEKLEKERLQAEALLASAKTEAERKTAQTEVDQARAKDVFKHPPGLPYIFDDNETDLTFEKAKEQAKKRLLEFNKTLPVETSTFELDAMTVSTSGGGHFVTYIKCDGIWLYDNGLSEGPLSTKDGYKEFSSFDDMITQEGDTIRKNLVLLYYSKVP